MTKTHWITQAEARRNAMGLGAALLAATLAFASAAGAADDEYKYTGVKDCGKCHDEELIGDQNAAWEKGPHAKAYETLESDESKKIAKEKGLSVPPHEAPECLRCHATAHGLDESDFHKRPLALSDGVQCESCHGPGSEYRKKKIMASYEKSVAAGMWEAGKNEEICTACHNQDSPTFEGFDFAEYKEKIAHPVPEDVKGRYLEIEKERKAERRRQMRGY